MRRELRGCPPGFSQSRRTQGPPPGLLAGSQGAYRRDWKILPAMQIKIFSASDESLVCRQRHSRSRKFENEALRVIEKRSLSVQCRRQDFLNQSRTEIVTRGFLHRWPVMFRPFKTELVAFNGPRDINVASTVRPGAKFGGVAAQFIEQHRDSGCRARRYLKPLSGDVHANVFANVGT